MDESRERRKVLLGVSGSIAAYKACEYARLLTSRGYQVRVVMSSAAQEFVSPLTFHALTGQAVCSDYFEGSEEQGIGHIEVADWADAMVVAPASADCIAKLAHGFADNCLLGAALATKAPVLVAPAMNVNMWENSATQANVTALRERGIQFVEPEEGDLACGWTGDGRLADPWEIFYATRRILSTHDFAESKVVVVTGPTREKIDAIRFLSNRSSGKMGMACAVEAFRRGARVTLIHGPVKRRAPRAIESVPVTTALEMKESVLEHAFGSDDPADVVVMAAAVADFRPSEAASHKIKKTDMGSSIALESNPDILSELGAQREGKSPLLCGFAVETGEIDELLEEGRRKLDQKNADIIIGNFAEDAFELNTNRVWILDRTGRQERIATTYKSRVATKILDAIRRIS